MAAHAAAEFAAQIARKGKRHLVEPQSFRVVEIFDFDAVVGVDTAAIRRVKIVVAEAIIVGEDVQPRKGSVLDLASQTLPACWPNRTIAIH